MTRKPSSTRSSIDSHSPGDSPDELLDDDRWMARALELARLGIARAHPNPMVGAVIVKKGRIVGQGFHTYAGLHHAEVVAIEKAGQAARGATLYLNLEPCCHTGRTGPCTEAIVAAGIRRVVAAMSDPNPAVAGRGFRRLRRVGVKITVGVREAEARQLNEAFAKWIRTHKPLVTMKTALTLDGRIAVPDGSVTWITSPESREEVQWLRHAADALMTGVGTVIADDPRLTDRTDLPRRRALLRVILDSRLRIPLRSKLVRDAHGDVLVFTTRPKDDPKARALRRAGVEVVRVRSHRGRIDLGEVVRELGLRQILSVLLEAGATLNGAALEAAIVDKIILFFAPKFIGDKGVPAVHGNWRALARLPSLMDLTFRRFGPDFSVEGYLRHVYGDR